MPAIWITNDYTPTKAYTDYVTMYVKEKGTTKRCLKLHTFCMKMKKGDVVAVGRDFFTGLYYSSIQ